MVSDREKRAKLIAALLDQTDEARTDPAELARVREMVLLFRRLSEQCQVETLETLKRKLSH